ncbi:unnamed protein product (macronuclear) [Paramecium tetraurelia]|uniref:Uncharacterized protein n=1 Tax=Paramecium tetraurelia TaxID=5888 RepID=A0CX48_PARTE|nr:uncharacterized protein GSPATT00001569001 [Paramecium tetraurelia]CAK75365.1 unnamed protein product [Paramecium tetraurelia]|eukprot:XP_001442762.1 hypothetical protein (macronuclear) [Paramecium tetraurelia strain d4-2]
MKQHENNYFVKSLIKPFSQVSTNSAVTRSIEQKPVSYLTFTRTKHRRKNETAIKLPELQPSSLRAKTEQDQPVINELKKSIVIISRKPSGVFQSQRIKTQPSIQVWEPEVKEFEVVKEIKQEKPKFVDVLCEELILGQKFPQFKARNQIKCKIKINELEGFQDRSSRILRKIIQLLKTHRERSEEKELKSKTAIDTQMLKSNIFIQTQTQYLPQQSLTNSKEMLFQQQLSAIPKKHTKFSSQITLTHQDESIKKMKSIIEAIKEKSQDKGKQVQVSATTPQFPVNNKKKIKVLVEYPEEQKQNKMEFFIPHYMEEDQIRQQQQSNEVIEIKNPKKSNIYSLVSKNMFNKKLNKIQNVNDQIFDEFNSDKAAQFTRYYLQNYVLKCLNQNKMKEQKDNETIPNIMRQDSKLDQQLFVSKVLFDQSIIQDFQTTRFLDINSFIYRCPEPFDSQNSSMLSDYSYLTNKSQQDYSYDQGMKLKYLSSSKLLNPRACQEKLIKFIISTISDDSKNVLLHEQIMAFDNNIEPIIHIDYELQCQPHLEAINRLFLRTNTKDRKKYLQLVYKNYENICIGQFEDDYKHLINTQEKRFIKYCYQQQNNSVDNTSIKNSNMLKSRHYRETTIETIPKQANLMTLSLPPATKSRSESPSNISETKTQKNASQNQQPVARNAFRKPSQKYLQVQGANKIQSQSQISKVQNLSVVKENEQQIVYKETQQIQQKSKQSDVKQQSMHPYSLLFRNMIIQQTKNEDKTLIEKIFIMVEEHRLSDLKEILKLEATMDINYQNEEGNTMLISASKCGATQIVDYLLKNGADVNIQNHNGQTAMDVALENYQFATADIIFKYLKPENKSF